MPIYKPALELIEQAPVTGPSLAVLFEALETKMQNIGAVDCEWTLGYVPSDIPEDERPKPGDLVPEIILRVRRV